MTYGLGNRRSILLSYGGKTLENKGQHASLRERSHRWLHPLLQRAGKLTHVAEEGKTGEASRRFPSVRSRDRPVVQETQWSSMVDFMTSTPGLVRAALNQPPRVDKWQPWRQHLLS